MKRFISSLILAMGLVAVAQESISVDNSVLAGNPLLKRFGVNIPATVDYNALKDQSQAISDLNLRYARLSTGWGEAGLGLYDIDPVSVSSDQVSYDFTRIDAIVDMLNQYEIQTHFATRCPQALASTPEGLPLNTEAWTQLWKTFSAHWVENGQRFISYEVLDGVGNSEMFAGSNQEYSSLLDAAYQGIIEGEGRSEWLRPKVYSAPSPSGEYNGSLIDVMGEFNLKGKVKGISSHVVGIDEFINCTRSFGGLRDKANGVFDWETMMSSYITNQDLSSEDNVNNVAVINFLEGLEEVLYHSDLTKIYLAQIMDGNDGSKGLLSASGVQTPLYHALKLYNQMPSDRRNVTGTDKLKAVASGDRFASAILVWNPSEEDVKADIQLNNIKFSNGYATLYVIGQSLTEENAGQLNGNSVSKSVNVPAKGCAFLIATNADQIIDNLPVKTAIADMHYWWFKFTEGWAWHGFDPQTMTAYTGVNNSYLSWGDPEVVGTWGATNFAIDMPQIPESKKLLIKFEQDGDVPGFADDNSKTMIRVSYMTEFVDEEADFYLKSYNYNTDWTDRTNFVYNHLGSQPDAFPNSGGEPVFVEEANFKTEGGWILDLGKNDPGLWNGHVRLIFYLQNPNAHANGTVLKYQVTDPDQVGVLNSEVTGIEDIAFDKRPAADIHLYGNFAYAAGNVRSIEVYNLSGHMMAKVAENCVDLSQLAKGAYIVRAIYADGTHSSAKILK